MAVALLLALSAVSLFPTRAESLAPAVRAGSPPVTIVLQPDGANGTDTFLLDQYPWWNFGRDPTLAVGRDAANGSLARSLLRFDLSAVPANATIRNATLELFAYGGGTGTVEIRRATAPWTEGSGGQSWTRVALTVRETAGVRRTLEPVAVDLVFAPGSVGDPRRDVQVWSGATEVPSQVSNIVTSGGFVTGARVVFGATVAAYGTQAFSVTYSPNGTAVPTYRTKGLGSSFLWRYGPTGSGASGATVADLDGDGSLDVIFGGADGNLYVLNSTGGLERSIPLSGSRSIPYTPQVRDMDGDGRMDIIVLVNTPEILRLNDTGGIVWSAPYGVNSIPYSTPTLTDVNGDGVLDVLVGGRTNQLDALNGVNGTLIRSYPAGGATFTASVLDLEGDGVGEIFFGSDDSRIHAFRAGGTPIWENASANATFIESSVSFGDLDGDGIPEVVTGDDSNNGPEFAMRATDGRLLWERDLPSWRESGQTLADLNGDGTLEVLVGVWDALYALSGRNGTILWSYPGGTSRTLYPAAVDIDNDGRPEIVYMDEGPIVRVLRNDGFLLWNWTITPNDPALRTLSQLPMATPAIADLDGDGTMEILVPTGDGMTAFGTGGLARDWRTVAYNWNHTQRANDGNSPDGAPFLVVTAGPAEDFPAAGASWDYRDGISMWAAAGGDLGSLDATADVAAGAWGAWNLTSYVSDIHAGTVPNTGLFLLEADETGGAVHRFQSSDAVDPLVRPRLTVTYVMPSVDPVPRIVGVIPDMTRAEDSPPWSIDLLGFAADADTPPAELRWNVSGQDGAKLGITGLNTPGNHLLTFYPQWDAFGDFRVTYWLP
ncbi:MAG TPA: FG-GAP-like repeat-containing protein, partial [Thermoplasmata archaeon]|nr:FG-GAP-like repeat-containing protein [Thermoplasmata archaeon]